MSEHREPQWFLDASLLIIGPLLVALLVCWFFFADLDSRIPRVTRFLCSLSKSHPRFIQLGRSRGDPTYHRRPNWFPPLDLPTPPFSGPLRLGTASRRGGASSGSVSSGFFFSALTGAAIVADPLGVGIDGELQGLPEGNGPSTSIVRRLAKVCNHVMTWVSLRLS